MQTVHPRSEGEVALAQLEAGDCFGEMAVVECRSRSVTVRAVLDGQALILKSTEMLPSNEKRPDQHAILILNLARDLSRGEVAEWDQVFSAPACGVDGCGSGPPSPEPDG